MLQTARQSLMFCPALEADFTMGHQSNYLVTGTSFCSEARLSFSGRSHSQVAPQHSIPSEDLHITHSDNICLERFFLDHCSSSLEVHVGISCVFPEEYTLTEMCTSQL